MKAEILNELNQIYESEGVLKPESVVEHASNPESALHGQFTWDDSKAAHEYRIWQARRLINVCVTILPTVNKEFRAFVSLESDRKQKGGGYRCTVDVLGDDEMRAELLTQALSELRRIRRQYETLKELAPVFKAIDKIEAKMPVPLAAH